MLQSGNFLYKMWRKQINSDEGISTKTFQKLMESDENNKINCNWFGLTEENNSGLQ